MPQVIAVKALLGVAFILHPTYLLCLQILAQQGFIQRQEGPAQGCGPHAAQRADGGQALQPRTARDVARGAVHVTLDRLEQKGFLRSTTGGSFLTDDCFG